MVFGGVRRACWMHPFWLSHLSFSWQRSLYTQLPSMHCWKMIVLSKGDCSHFVDPWGVHAVSVGEPVEAVVLCWTVVCVSGWAVC